jgi:hypothetical protein
MPSIFAPCRFYLLVFLAVFNQAVAADPAHHGARAPVAAEHWRAVHFL